MKYSNRPLYERIAASPVALLAAVVLLFVLARAAWNIHEKAVASGEKLSEENAELAKLEQNQNELSSKVAYLSSDEGVEAEMRTKFKAVKDGEQVAVIVDNQAAGVAEATSTGPVLSWWGKVLQFFRL